MHKWQLLEEDFVYHISTQLEHMWGLFVSHKYSIVILRCGNNSFWRFPFYIQGAADDCSALPKYARKLLSAETKMSTVVKLLLHFLQQTATLIEWLKKCTQPWNKTEKPYELSARLRTPLDLV